MHTCMFFMSLCVQLQLGPLQAFRMMTTLWYLNTVEEQNLNFRSSEKMRSGSVPCTHVCFSWVCVFSCSLCPCKHFDGWLPCGIWTPLRNKTLTFVLLRKCDLVQSHAHMYAFHEFVCSAAVWALASILKDGYPVVSGYHWGTKL